MPAVPLQHETDGFICALGSRFGYFLCGGRDYFGEYLPGLAGIGAAGRQLFFVGMGGRVYFGGVCVMVLIVGAPT